MALSIREEPFRTVAVTSAIFAALFVLLGIGGVAVAVLLLVMVAATAIVLFGGDDRHQRQRHARTETRETVGTVPTPNPTTDDALAELRRRYAAGELSETQFEGRIERLLADEDDTDDARAVLELRYARGELSDEQFDRKLARLDGTRTIERAEREYHIDAES